MKRRQLRKTRNPKNGTIWLFCFQKDFKLLHSPALISSNDLLSSIPEIVESADKIFTLKHWVMKFFEIDNFLPQFIIIVFTIKVLLTSVYSVRLVVKVFTMYGCLTYCSHCEMADRLFTLTGVWQNVQYLWWLWNCSQCMI